MKQYTRYIIAIVCVGIIILRAFFPKINFDNISLILLGIGVLAIIVPEPKLIFDRAKKLKLWGFEMELREFNKSTEKIEERIQEKEPNKRMSGHHTAKENEYKFTGDIEADILRMSIEIEKTLRSIYENAFDTINERPLSFNNLVFKLKDKNVVDGDTANWLLKSWTLRNEMIHSHKFTLTKQTYLAFSDIGMRVLNILKTIQGNLPMTVSTLT